MPHFIYCGIDSTQVPKLEELEDILLAKMKINGIESSMITTLHMERLSVVTKETNIQAYEGKLNDGYHVGWDDYTESVNDDLETFFYKCLNQEDDQEKGDEDEDEVWSFFLPKLTEKEFKLLKNRDQEYLKTFYFYRPEEYEDQLIEDLALIEISDSKEKYSHGQCYRRTAFLTLDLIQKKEMFKRCIQQCDRVEAFNTSKRKKRLDEMIEEYENM